MMRRNGRINRILNVIIYQIDNGKCNINKAGDHTDRKIIQITYIIIIIMFNRGN